jgi:Bacterial Ig-like domain/Concanavalin A-like lectin/glucanases superfamily
VNRRIVAVACALASVATLVGSIGAASAAGTGSVLDLELNDSVGATAAVDTSGLGHPGAVGSHLVMNGSYAHFDRHSPSEGISYGLAHLITVPDAADGSLDPGSGNFSVEIRYRTKESFGNVLQKGQATSVGGQVKLQQPKGKLTCMFKTPQGTATAGSGATPLNDNLFHTVRCDRTPTSVTMYVDGVQTGKVNHVTGTLDNKKPWTLGGKPECDGTTVTCDYFSGDIDYVRLTKGDGGGGGDTTPPSVTTTSPVSGGTLARSGNVTATFSEPVSGVTGTSMTLKKTGGGAFAGAVSYDDATQTATLNPNLTLPARTNFTVSLSSSIHDAAGNPLAATSWSFTTGS